MDGREQTIQYLTQVKRDLHAKREKLLRPVQEIDKEIEYITGALAIALRNGVSDEKESPLGFPLKKLRGKTQTQALIEIAKYNGGKLRSLDARAILIGAQLMRPTKNTARMINGLISRSEAFDRVGRGEYRLKAEASKTEEELTHLFDARPVQ